VSAAGVRAGSAYQPVIRPSSFTADVSNRWFPLRPGGVLVYAGTKDGKRALDILARADVGAFAAFERSASNEADGRPDESGAAGLGLAIVRMITEGHGGQVSAANRPAGGLTVQLVLPDGSHPSQPTAGARPATCQRAHAAHRGRRYFRYDSPRGDNR